MCTEMRRSSRGFVVYELTAQVGTESERELRKRSKRGQEWLPIARSGPHLLYLLDWSVWEGGLPDGALVAAFGSEVHPHFFHREEVVAFRASITGSSNAVYEVHATRTNGDMEPIRENLTDYGVIAYIRGIRAIAEVGEETPRRYIETLESISRGIARLKGPGETTEIPIGLGTTESLIIRRSDKTNPPPRD